MIWLNQGQIGLTGERGSPFQRSSILFLIAYDHLGVVELSDLISPTNSNIFSSMNLANKPQWALPYKSERIKSVFPENGKSFEFSISISWLAKWE